MPITRLDCYDLLDSKRCDAMKWVKRILLSLVVVILLSLTVVYAWSSVIINKQYTAQARNILPSSRPEIVAHGERMAQVFGCYFGCHGKDMEGKVFFEGWAIGKIISPNLTRAVDTYSRSELEAIIRQGIKPDGTSVLVMPSASFVTMTDRDLSAILAFIEDFPKQELDLGNSSYGILPRFMLVLGEYVPSAAEVDGTPVQANSLQDPVRLGEYLAQNTCSECHGLDYEGQGDFTPSLQIAKGYSEADFNKLMMTGKGIGDRDLGLMSEVAESRFSKMNNEEISALHQFLMLR
ncbi:MAG: mono/diheme cytochrome c family protein [Lysobacterales bacterium]|jgi:mono/diheme cytochrome c family protein